MIGSLLSRTLILLLGYVYPAYECYKTVELNKPEIKLLLFWCQYWILTATLAVLERFGDVFISWLPMYAETKVAFYIYLWSPKTKGTTFVYEAFFRPFMAKHEAEIDRGLVEFRRRVGDVVALFLQRVASHGQTRFFEILQYAISLPNSSSTHPIQNQQPEQSQDEQPTKKKQGPSSEAIGAIKPAFQEATRAPPPSPNTKGGLPEQLQMPSHLSVSDINPANSGTISHLLRSEEPTEVEVANSSLPPRSPHTRLRRQPANVTPSKLGA